MRHIITARKKTAKTTVDGSRSGPTGLLWSPKRTPTRGPKPTHSTKEIGLAAVRIADEEGLDAVTMQRVAQEVGLTTMALYRYFPGKSELMAVMIDSAGESSPRFGDSSAPWNDRLREWARRCAAIYRDHPWFLEATTARRTPMGPNELLWMESALQMLIDSGLSPGDAYHAFLAVIGHVRAHAMFEQMRSRTESLRKWVRDLSRLLRSQGGKYSALQAVLDSGAFAEGPGPAFECGMTWILGGIRASQRGSDPKYMKAK